MGEEVRGEVLSVWKAVRGKLPNAEKVAMKRGESRVGEDFCFTMGEFWAQLKCLQKSYLRKALVEKKNRRRDNSYWTLLKGWDLKKGDMSLL